MHYQRRLRPTLLQCIRAVSKKSVSLAKSYVLQNWMRILSRTAYIKLKTLYKIKYQIDNWSSIVE